MKDIIQALENKAGPRAMEILNSLGEFASAYGMGLYLVGGAVRDLFLDAAGGFDLDLVVEGDAQAFAYGAASKLGGRCETHKNFGTASIEIPGEPPLRMDFATARTETYRKPGALPTVTPAKSIHDDLSRRDFSINAMALCLTPPGRGEIVDPHGGLEDIENRLLRVLHEASFEDDPTRILRGVRFRSRLGFEFERQTASLASRAIEERRLSVISGARIRKEIRASLEEPRRADIINELNRLDIDEAIVPGWRLNTRLIEPDDLVAEAAKTFEPLPDAPPVLMWAAYLLAASEGADQETLETVARRIALSKKEAAPLLDALAHSSSARTLLADEDASIPEVEDLLSTAEPETLVMLHAADGSGVARERIEAFLGESGRVRLEISGRDLLSMGHEPSPVFGQVLREVLRAKIEGAVKNRKQELALARKLLYKWD